MQLNKICKTCKDNKSVDLFYTINYKNKKEEKKQIYSSECKECQRKRTADWIRNNRERHREAARIRDSREHSKKKRLEYNKKKYAEGWYKQYRKDNIDKFKEWAENHRNHEITEFEWEECKRYFSYSCAYCGMTEEEHKEFYKQRLHKEHVQHDGLNDVTNCVPSCKSCNSRKRKQKLHEWYNVDNELFEKNKLDRILKWINFDSHEIKNLKGNCK
ncbi:MULTISPECIES: HNH endonuclease [Lysinibacillus]|uniref:HNH endonuclease n=1 Tax=Lysinibacillus TaxID=400634 RepID=UPI00214B0AB0|nr:MULTISPECIES: HNH endonuclease [Lysinibacillus]UUV25928.1 HNH endonuclease [Lysinibacillus sp. FN11]UYB48801.1 HNH endonuclease [Lysinibacillus capsici]